MEANEFFSFAAQYTEKALEDFLPQTDDVRHKTLSDAMRYSLLNGGKRIRAALCLEFCKACGGEYSDALPFACALEMVHAYSLIHDDLPCMDDDDMRRGKPSCHIAFCENTALLAGDALQALAFETALKSPEVVSRKNTIRAAGLLANCAGYLGMAGGQQLDLDSENTSINYTQLSYIQLLKTGALIKAACQMGCLAANAPEEKITAAGIYAEKIGRVFQMIDDVLDVIADEAELGKPIGSDAENCKTTFATLFGIEKTMKEAEIITNEAIDSIALFGDNAEMLKKAAILLLKRKK